MIIISQEINKIIDDYVFYLIDNGITSQKRAFEKRN